ncbi:MAG: TM2 domain-containing protein [Clostridia bacterium]|nr:TM2 domain-containing protein [Clostridia bacterium]
MEDKFCKFCGEKIPFDAVVCTKCGRQVEKFDGGKEGIVINNVANSAAAATAEAAAVNSGKKGGKTVSKWTSFALCLFGGYIGLHKFYEGKTGMGVLYLCTLGLFGIGWIIDIFGILGKPDPYEV